MYFTFIHFSFQFDDVLYRQCCHLVRYSQRWWRKILYQTQLVSCLLVQWLGNIEFHTGRRVSPSGRVLVRLWIVDRLLVSYLSLTSIGFSILIKPLTNHHSLRRAVIAIVFSSFGIFQVVPLSIGNNPSSSSAGLKISAAVVAMVYSLYVSQRFLTNASHCLSAHCSLVWQGTLLRRHLWRWHS